MGWDNDLMFSDAQAMTGTAATLCTQSIPLTPLQDMTGRNIGVGNPLFIEVYGTLTGGTASGTFLIELVTAANAALTSSLVVVQSNVGIGSSGSTVIPTVAVTVDGTSAAFWKIPIPIWTDLKTHIGLRYTNSVSAAGFLFITAGVTMIPTSLRAVGSGMNFN